VPKRRLPLLQTSAQDDSAEPPRPAWQWVTFGALAIFVAWVPLSALAGALATRLIAHASEGVALRRAALLVSCVYGIELAVGALAGGYLVGRWGPPSVGARDSALAGLVAAAVVTIWSWASSGSSSGLPLVVLVVPAVAGLGGKLGLRGRAR
jgi:uncharacterized membrane protein YeaQ/YmgE (transglycosylase-associated protein family)